MGIRNFSIVIVLVILAACAEASRSRVSLIPGEAGGIDSTLRYEAADGVVPVVLRGNPFTGSQVAQAAQVAGALRLPPGWPRASFASTPQAEQGQGIRLVLVFNASSVQLEARELCRDLDAVELMSGATDTTWVLAAFCIGSRLGRGASARGPGPAAMNPEFRSLLDNMLLNLFQVRTPRPNMG